MLCQKCGIHEASVKLIKNYNGNVKEMIICPKCANEEDLHLGFGFQSKDGFNNLLSMFTPFCTEETTCPRCGIAYRTLKSTGKFGCDHCVTTFESYLEPLFKSIHGDIAHTGKIPKRASESVKAKRALETKKMLLKEAVENERYEEAAKLRDEIKKISEGGGLK